MPTVYVKTLGCKVNTYDGAAILSQFRERGFTATDSLEGAQVAILNTCSVTANAEREARSLIRRMRRTNPETLIVATGCYAQTHSASLVGMDEVDLVVPNEAKDRIVGEVEARLGRQQLTAKMPQGVKAVNENRQGHFKAVLNLNPVDPRQTRAFLKIQDGCNGFCTYCLIPLARGQSRSVEPHAVLGEVRRLIDQGIKEIVFTGIHLGDYGRDLADATHAEPFAALLGELFSWPDMVRLRISSLEPSELTIDLIEALASRRELVCDHFHLPLQSGSDAVLRRMRRTYNVAEYQEALNLAKKFFPEACFGADVIPGFPGESDEDFRATMEFIRSSGLHYLHVFPYSKRPNTAAARMPDHLPGDLVRQRAQELRALSDTLLSSYRRNFIGRTLPVLWEKGSDKEGRRTGLTPNYLEVVAAQGDDPSWNTITPMTLKGFTADQRLLGLAPRPPCH